MRKVASQECIAASINGNIMMRTSPDNVLRLNDWTWMQLEQRIVMKTFDVWR